MTFISFCGVNNLSLFFTPRMVINVILIEKKLNILYRFHTWTNVTCRRPKLSFSIRGFVTHVLTLTQGKRIRSYTENIQISNLIISCIVDHALGLELTSPPVDSVKVSCSSLISQENKKRDDLYFWKSGLPRNYWFW